MNDIRKKIITCLIMTMFCAIGAKSQIQLSFAPGVGFNYNMHSFEKDGTEHSLSGFGAVLSGQFDIQFSRNLGLLLWIDAFNDMSGSNKISETDNSAVLRYFSIAPTLKIYIPGYPFYVYAGPGFGLFPRCEYTLGNDVIDIGEYGKLNTRVDLRLGLGYEIYLSDRITLSPYIGFNYGLTSVDDVNFQRENWKVNAINGGLVLKINIF